MAAPEASQASPRRPVPTTGMRGGLGRILLTAFLALAIGPLGVMGYLAFVQVRNDQQQRAFEQMVTIADLTGVQLQNWVEEQTAELTLLAERADIKGLLGQKSTSVTNRIPEAQAQMASHYRDLESIWLQDIRTNQIWLIMGDMPPDQFQTAPSLAAFPPSPARLVIGADDKAHFFIVTPVARENNPGGYLAGLAPVPDHSFISKLVSETRHLTDLYLVNQSGRLFYLNGEPLVRADAQPVNLSEATGLNPATLTGDWQGVYVNHSGQVVLGVYHQLPELGCALLVEQEQDRVLATSESFAAGLIAATLGVALLTAIIAAVVTRQITRPIVRLTEAALQMAEGDLSQRVQIDRRDEIGILARVFNKMASDLGEVYAGLEKKVAERTRELESAKEQIQYHAWQLSISAEVGRITTSILDMDTLLDKAAQLIRDAFQLDRVSIYLLDSAGEIAILWKNAGRAAPDYERQLHIGGNHPVSWVISHRLLRVTRGAGCDSRLGECHRLVLPLALGAKVVGALDLASYDPAGFSESDQGVLQALADQLTVAIENARAYGRERKVVDEMREVDRLRGQFLARMSHQLATYLNTIIGFSQVMLKGLDGPLTETQMRDLTTIRQSGQQLLRLHNDILELATLEVGNLELHMAPVNLTVLLNELQTSLAATIINPRLRLEIKAESELPTITADADRLKQVITNLVITATEISRSGIITLSVTRGEGQLQFTLSAPAVWENLEGDHGVSLALSRRLIEMHGGRLRTEQHADGETVLKFSLPVKETLL